MKRLALLLALSLSALPVSAQTVRPAPSWLRYYLPIHPQVVVIGGSGTTFNGGAVTGATSFLDTTNFSIKNTADTTKVAQFDASGISTATTRTYTLPNASSTLCVASVDCAFTTTQTFNSGNNTGATFNGDEALSLTNTIGQSGVLVTPTAQTPDAPFLATGTLSNSWIVAEYADRTFDFAHALQTDPTIFLHSHNQNKSQYIALWDDATSAQVAGGDAIAGTDTNTAGQNMTLSPGKGTGTAASEQASISRDLVGSTGTVAQTRVDGFVVCESKTLSNTSATVATLVNIASASNSAGGSEWTTTVVATDGTNFDVEQQTCNVGWVNKAGVFTVATPVCTATVAASNSGSTTVGSTVTAAASVVAIKATPVFTTIVPTTVTAYTTIRNNSPGAVTCQ